MTAFRDRNYIECGSKLEIEALKTDKDNNYNKLQEILQYGREM